MAGTPRRPNVHGIDHIGLTVPDLEAATTFLVEALDAEVLYDTMRASEPPRGGPDTVARLGIPPTMAQRAIRMLRLPNGPGIELFQYEGPDQRAAVVPSDLGWQHLAFYVDDIDLAVERLEAAGARRNADPRDLGGVEKGPGDEFCYVVTPWGSTIELITYPSPQPYLATADQPKWTP